MKFKSNQNSYIIQYFEEKVKDEIDNSITTI